MSLPINPTIDLGTQLYIEEVKKFGVLVSIWITARGTQYEMRYFLDGKPETAYFFGNELSMQQEEKQIGFLTDSTQPEE